MHRARAVQHVRRILNGEDRCGVLRNIPEILIKLHVFLHEEIQEEQQEVAAQQQQLEETKQTANLLKAPLMDPTKNPQLAQTPPQ